MAEVGRSTGKNTQAGREVYETSEGEMVSEKSTTFKYKGEWINVPTIFEGLSYDDDTLRMMLDAEVIKPTSTHTNKEDAIKAAAERSESLRFNEGGLADLDGKLKLFNEGGAVMNEQMEMAFGDAGERVDPVSGNEVPPGSLPEEVRDDIPAMLSEGEYVVPADVLRFYGVKFFEDLRSQAKMGLAEMESNGRIGGEPIEEGTGEVGISDEDLMAIMAQAPQDEQAVGAANGGLMGFQQGGLSFPEYIKQPDISQFGMAGPDFQGGLEYRKFVNDAGMTMTIPFFNGEPMGMIPPGYTEGDAPTATEKVEQDRRDDNDDPVRPPVPVKDEFDLDAIPTEKLEQTAKGLSTMNNIATGIATAVGLPLSALVNTAGVARYNDVIERYRVEDPEAFEKSGLERKNNMFGGESSLFEDLQDSDGSGGNSFGDTWLGDLLGFDGKAGVQGPDLKASRGGARRTEVGGETTGGGESRNAASDFAKAATGSIYVKDSDGKDSEGTGRRVTTYDPEEVKKIAKTTKVGGR